MIASTSDSEPTWCKGLQSDCPDRKSGGRFHSYISFAPREKTPGVDLTAQPVASSDAVEIFTGVI
jgi:uncharacterized protein (DUF983 family)